MHLLFRVTRVHMVICAKKKKKKDNQETSNELTASRSLFFLPSFIISLENYPPYLITVSSSILEPSSCPIQLSRSSLPHPCGCVSHSGTRTNGRPIDVTLSSIETSSSSSSSKRSASKAFRHEAMKTTSSSSSSMKKQRCKSLASFSLLAPLCSNHLHASARKTRHTEREIYSSHWINLSCH